MYAFRPQWRFFHGLTSQALWLWMTRGSCSCPHNSKPSHALFWWTADLLWSSAFGAQCGTRSETLTDSFTSDWDPRLRVERSVPCMDDHSEARTLISFCNVAWRSRFYLKVLSALAFYTIVPARLHAGNVSRQILLWGYYKLLGAHRPPRATLTQKQLLLVGFSRCCLLVTVFRCLTNTISVALHKGHQESGVVRLLSASPSWKETPSIQTVALVAHRSRHGRKILGGYYGTVTRTFSSKDGNSALKQRVSHTVLWFKARLSYLVNFIVCTQKMNLLRGLSI